VVKKKKYIQPGSGLLVDYSQGALQDYDIASNVGSGVEVMDGDNSS
jgi:hypothetical protein